ncbi:unnamed protein product [Cercopithifilaria johnstoni]|uniref:Uncharacterized protein n=1 Tax=Cercopithifilaria johnstoni TaxID=2874296 RepID=A0A8J2Q9I0_9BILA|nr:unnamed protein product [Cercopithifilaria johnstoni]
MLIEKWVVDEQRNREKRLSSGQAWERVRGNRLDGSLDCFLKKPNANRMEDDDTRKPTAGNQSFTPTYPYLKYQNGQVQKKYQNGRVYWIS